MTEENLNISPDPNSVICIAAAMILVFIIPVIAVIRQKKRCGKNASFKYLFIGAAGFIVSARILELGLHMICIVSDNPVSRFINGNTAAYVIYGVLAAGIFEECGRYVIIRFILKKNISRENAVMYGIGHGGIECWTVTLVSLASLLAVAVTYNTQGIGAVSELIGVTKDNENAAADYIRSAVGFNAVSAFLTAFERLMCMFVHTAWTVIVSYGVFTSRKKYLAAAVLLHAVLDTFAALYQRGAVSLAAVEIWLLLWTVPITLWSISLYRKMRKETEI